MRLIFHYRSRSLSDFLVLEPFPFSLATHFHEQVKQTGVLGETNTPVCLITDCVSVSYQRGIELGQSRFFAIKLAKWPTVWISTSRIQTILPSHPKRKSMEDYLVPINGSVHPSSTPIEDGLFCMEKTRQFS